MSNVTLFGRDLMNKYINVRPIIAKHLILLWPDLAEHQFICSAFYGRT